MPLSAPFLFNDLSEKLGSPVCAYLASDNHAISTARSSHNHPRIGVSKPKCRRCHAICKRCCESKGIGLTVWGQQLQHRGIEARFHQRSTVIGEAHEAAVECGIPMLREQQTVVNVQPLLIASAFGPGHDTAGAQHRLFVDAGQRAATAPIVEQRPAEIALAYSLLDDPLHLGIAELCNLGLELDEGKARGAACESKSPRHDSTHRLPVGKGKSRAEMTRCWFDHGGGQFLTQYSGNPGVLDSEEPCRTISLNPAGNCDLTRHALV